MKCVECGAEFVPKAPNQLCCSSECRKRRQAKQNLELYRKKKVYVEFKPKKCKVCGNEFTPTTANQRYCSDQCRKQGNRVSNRENGRKRMQENNGKIVSMDGMIREICPVCGKQFYRTNMWAYKRGETFFCSWSCLSKHDKESGINLTEYYRKSDAIKYGRIKDGAS